ncbi:MAG: TIGR01777 family oxidoreductase [Myxococcota bacterium]
MRIAITGGTGFIGSALVQRLLAEGHEVKVLSRHPQRARLPKGASAGFFDAFLPLEEGLLDDMEAVVHLAGEPIGRRWTAEHKERVRQSRAVGTRSIAEGAARAKVKTLLSASAVGFYGPRGDEPLTEEASPGTDFLAQVCQRWEQAATPAKEAGVRVVHPRIGTALHPEGGVLGRLLLPFKLGAGGRLGSGEQYMSWIHRDDLVSLLVFLLTKSELAGPVNATAPHPVTNRVFTKTLAHALHRPAVLPAPAFALELALGEMSTLLLDGQRVVPKRALDAGFTFAFPHLSGALEDLLGHAQPLPAGLGGDGHAPEHEVAKN